MPHTSTYMCGVVSKSPAGHLTVRVRSFGLDPLPLQKFHSFDQCAPWRPRLRRTVPGAVPTEASGRAEAKVPGALADPGLHLALSPAWQGAVKTHLDIFGSGCDRRGRHRQREDLSILAAGL